MCVELIQPSSAVMLDMEHAQLSRSAAHTIHDSLAITLALQCLRAHNDLTLSQICVGQLLSEWDTAS